jgi:hypothetical protein
MSHSGGQQMHYLIRDTHFISTVFRPLVCILSQKNPIHSLPPCFFKRAFISILSSRLLYVFQVFSSRHVLGLHTYCLCHAFCMVLSFHLPWFDPSNNSVTCLRHAAIVETQKSVNTLRNNRGSCVYSVPFRAAGGRAVPSRVEPHCTTLVSKAIPL